MVSHQDCTIYFIQTSLSTYSKQKTKKANLFKKEIEGRKVFSHYCAKFKSKYKGIYIYATAGMSTSSPPEEDPLEECEGTMVIVMVKISQRRKPRRYS